MVVLMLSVANPVISTDLLSHSFLLPSWQALCLFLGRQGWLASHLLPPSDPGRCEFWQAVKGHDETQEATVSLSGVRCSNARLASGTHLTQLNEGYRKFQETTLSSRYHPVLQLLVI